MLYKSRRSGIRDRRGEVQVGVVADEREQKGPLGHVCVHRVIEGKYRSNDINKSKSCASHEFLQSEDEDDIDSVSNYPASSSSDLPPHNCPQNNTTKARCNPSCEIHAMPCHAVPYALHRPFSSRINVGITMIRVHFCACLLQRRMCR